MKKIVRNIILLGSLLFVVNQCIHAFLLPFTWGDKDLHAKMTYFEKHKDEYSALFVGGSLVYRHIDPSITDSMCQANGIDFRAFNTGVDGVAFLKQMRVIEEVIQNPSPELKYIFVSLSSTTRFKYLNLHTKRFTSWQRPQEMFRAIRLTWELKIPIKQKLKFSWYYFITMLENGFNVGMMTDAIQYLTHPETEYVTTTLGENHDGFFPYDEQEQLVFEKDSWEYRMQEMMLLSRKNYVEQVGRRDTMLLQNIYEFENFDENYVLKSMLARYNKMIKACNEKGIQLIVILPPRGREPYTHLIPTFNQLPESNKINLASPIEYPDFYLPENSYNFYHLNQKGATLYSKILTQRILELQGIDWKTNSEEPIVHPENETD